MLPSSKTPPAFPTEYSVSQAGLGSRFVRNFAYCVTLVDDYMDDCPAPILQFDQLPFLGSYHGILHFFSLL